MKKVLAVVLALCMVFAMGTVAFAANEVISKGTDPQTGSIDVLTKLKDGETPADYDSYTVTIPADITFEWDASESQSANALVKYELALGSSLKISVNYADKADDDGLTCEMTGATETTYAGYGVVAEDIVALTNTFTMTEWNATPGVYTVGTATYTVNYTPAV